MTSATCAAQSRTTLRATVAASWPSEFNDFTKPLDRHSYQACLDTIEQADIFLLLIGARVGGWYDETKKVSITQQEYRRAYELAQADKIRLMSFVRANVWAHRQDAKSLEKHLAGLSELDDAMRRKIARFPTSFADDSEFIVSFIDEVCRNKETVEAAKGTGTMPIGNWVHPFTAFSDIRSVVDPLILNGLSVTKAAGRKALQNQLLILLRDVLPKGKDGPLIPAPTVLRLAAEIGLTVENLTGSAKLPDKIWNTFVFLGTMVPAARLDPNVFSSVLGTDLLLEYEPTKGVFSQTAAYDLLTDLIDQIRKFEQVKTGYEFSKLIGYGRAGRNRDKTVSVPVHLVAGQMQVLFRWIDIAALARVLVVALDGKPLVIPKRMPLTPFQDQEVEVAKEQVSLEQVRQFVGLDNQMTAADAVGSSVPRAPRY
jgi:hypothetical protein